MEFTHQGPKKSLHAEHQISIERSSDSIDVVLDCVVPEEKPVLVEKMNSKGTMVKFIVFDEVPSFEMIMKHDSLKAIFRKFAESCKMVECFYFLKLVEGFKSKRRSKQRYDDANDTFVEFILDKDLRRFLTKKTYATLREAIKTSSITTGMFDDAKQDIESHIDNMIKAFVKTKEFTTIAVIQNKMLGLDLNKQENGVIMPHLKKISTEPGDLESIKTNVLSPSPLTLDTKSARSSLDNSMYETVPPPCPKSPPKNIFQVFWENIRINSPNSKCLGDKQEEDLPIPQLLREHGVVKEAFHRIHDVQFHREDGIEMKDGSRMIQALIFELRSRDFHLTEGLFRISGHHQELNRIILDINQGKHVDFSIIEDVHNLGSLLKVYLRSLPEPLISFDLYDEFIALTQIHDDDEKRRALYNSLDRIPKDRRPTLSLLLDFLTEIETHSSLNLMDAQNLSVTFGVNILRPNGTFDSLREFYEAPKISRAVKELIFNYQKIRFVLA